MMRFTQRTLAATAAAIFLTAGTHTAAESVTFDFKDPKGVNGVVFVLDSEVEPITGMIGGVGGTVSYDPAEPASFDGEITVDLGQLSFINGGMTQVLRGADWLNFSDTFVATMTFDKVLDAAATDGGQMLSVEGTLSFGGKEVPLAVAVEVSHVKDGAAKRGGGKSGDLLVLRSMFNISRLDLGIREDIPAGSSIGETITVMVPIAGYSK